MCHSLLALSFSFLSGHGFHLLSAALAADTRLPDIQEEIRDDPRIVKWEGWFLRGASLGRGVRFCVFGFGGWCSGRCDDRGVGFFAELAASRLIYYMREDNPAYWLHRFGYKH